VTATACGRGRAGLREYGPVTSWSGRYPRALFGSLGSLRAERRLDAQFVHGVHQDREVMAEGFAQDFVDLRRGVLEQTEPPKLRFTMENVLSKLERWW